MCLSVLKVEVGKDNFSKNLKLRDKCLRIQRKFAKINPAIICPALINTNKVYKNILCRPRPIYTIKMIRNDLELADYIKFFFKKM